MTGEGGAGPARVSSLSFHADYRCQNTGVCCSSGWDIAVETSVQASLAPRLASRAGVLPRDAAGFVALDDPPQGCQSAFRRDETGVCWFRDQERHDCAIHREFGEDSLASACRQFPRIAVLESDQTSVSLSHYCPTAAGLLFRESEDFRLVDAPEAFPVNWPFEGLDTRGAYSPLLRPGVLLGFDGLRVFEAEAVAVLSRPGIEVALAHIERSVGRIRRWQPEHGGLPDQIRAAFANPPPVPEGATRRDPRQILTASLPPAAVGVPSLPGRADAAGRSAPDDTLDRRIDRALRRYVAARLIGGWILFQSDDLATVSAYLRLCLGSVYLFESARDRVEPEIDRWREAIREADLWLLHHCDPERLAANLR